MTFPPPVAALVGRHGLRLSLRTPYRKAAHLRAAALLVGLSRIIPRLEMDRTATMEQLRAKLADELRRMVEEWTDHHLDRKRPLERDALEEQEELYAVLRSDAQEAKAVGDWRRWAGRAAVFTERHALPIAPESDEFRRLCMELGEVETRFYDEVRERMDGNYSGSLAMSLGALQAAPAGPSPAPAVLAGMPPEMATLRLSEAVERYCNFNIQAGKWKNKKAALEKDYGPPLRAFAEFLKDKPLGELTKGDALTYFEMMVTRQDIGAATQSKILGRVAALLRYCHEKLQYPADIAGALKTATTPEHESYERFTADDLRALFESDAYRGMVFEKSYQYWVPLICLYTGSRLGEPSSILLKDVKELHGGPAYFLSGEGNQGGKNKNGPRWVPVHPELIKAGFLEYVEMVRAEGHTFLFPDIYDHPISGRSFEPSGFFTAYRRSVNVGKQQGEGKSTKAAHSFRSTFISAMVEARIDGGVRRKLVGHAAKDVHEAVYDQSDIWAELVKAVEAVSFGLNHAPFRDSPAFKTYRDRNRPG
jgi:integrase